jgi:L-ascorbate metabolism protein UlaG (beta-lactamase superfamily)
MPAAERLERVKASPNYRDGKFRNIHHTPDLTEGHNLWEVSYEFLFKRRPDRQPPRPIPAVYSDLKQLSKAEDVLVWFGHSSYFLQINGKTFLVDPVFSGYAAPISASNKAFPGADIFKVSDLPPIDVLLITHDHYDHLDFQTVLQLKGQVQQVVCGLGVGAHLEHWGYAAEQVTELDWWEQKELAPGFTLSATPARHFSGRGLQRNRSLWLSFVLQTPTMKLFLGGDSGYDTHFEDIGSKYGPFDLAILENGQYDPKWKYIHMQPAEVLMAAKDLQAKRLLPVHSAKFAMANHGWDEPLKTITSLAQDMPLLTPMIGEIVYLDRQDQGFEAWWTNL